MSVKPSKSREGLSSDAARHFNAGSAKPDTRSSGNFLAGLASITHTLGFALWFGGLIVLGAVVAPNAANLIQSHPEIAGNAALKNAILNGIIGASFRIFNRIAYVCGALMLLADYLEIQGANRLYRAGTLIRAGFTVLALGTAIYQGVLLFPAMDKAQASHNMAAFDQMHAIYEVVGMAQMVLLFVVAITTAARNTRSHDRD